MKSIKENALKILKKMVEKEVNAGDELSSKCVAIMYQPKRKPKSKSIK